jgi:hypothetical protein
MSARTVLVGQIDFFLAVTMAIRNAEVFKLFNNLVFAFFNQSFKLLVFGSDFIGELYNNFVSIFLDGLLLLSKFVLYALKVAFEALEQLFCFFSDSSFDRGLNASHRLAKENLNACIFTLVDDLTLDLNDRFQHCLHSLLGLALLSCLDIACSQSFRASGMDHFDRIRAELLGHFNRHVVLRDHILVLSHKRVEFLHHFH